MTKNITPTKFRCGDVDALCPSIHETEKDFFLIGTFAPKGVLATIGVPPEKLPGPGESAIRYPREFMDAFFMEYAAKKLANAK